MKELNPISKTVSYAQNAEDIVLLRALKHIQRGFYVDVGAWHPTKESVTKVFYDLGWSGINIEPQKELIGELTEHRQRDTNLSFAISDNEDDVVLWIPRHSALATCNPEFLHPEIPDYSACTKHKVESKTLQSVLLEYCQNSEISFLKIDVEGYEESVLNSVDLQKFRPIVILVEAVSPHDGSPTWMNWEPILLENGYQFALFDGLNRFYLRDESNDLMPKLAIPANCIDSFITQREYRVQQKLRKACSELEKIGANVASLFEDT